MKKLTQAVLFDLDGTLLDTAPDILNALNQLRQEHGFGAFSLAEMRAILGLGSKPMTKAALGIEEDHPNFLGLRERLLTLYQDSLAKETQLFPRINDVLTQLETQQIPWGIVTNKLTRHAIPLLKELGLHERPGCIICGDTLAQYKPDPAPILHACAMLKADPKHCLYVGDAATDVMASKAAGTTSIVALYGYIGEKDDPYSWQADGYVEEPWEILQWVKGAAGVGE